MIFTISVWFHGNGARPSRWTLADSYIQASASPAGAAAEMAASRKLAKFASLSGAYVVQLIALENLGPINESAVEFLNNLGHRITLVSFDDKEGQFLYHRLSIALQRFNAILLHQSFVSDVDPDLWPSSYFVFRFFVAFKPRDLYYRGYQKINIVKK